MNLIQTNYNLDETLDSSSIKYMNVEEQFNQLKQSMHVNANKNLQIRNDQYSTLLSIYVSAYANRIQKNLKLKSIYSYVFSIIAVLVIVTTIIVLFVTAWSIYKTNNINVGLLTALITAFGTLIATIILIPKIIAEYLFSVKEDEYMADIIKSLLAQDDKIRQLIEDKHTNQK